MSDGQQASILLVEDDAQNLTVMTKLLRLQGFTVHGARTATEGATLAAGNRIDLAICDIHLPDRSGADLMKELKERYRMKGLALTGAADPATQREVDEAGFDACLVKPVLYPELLAVVQNLLE